MPNNTLTAQLLTPQLLPLVDSGHWYVAFSGGLDSTVLLHLLHSWCRHHPGAPALLHRAILYSKGVHPHYSHWLSDDVTGHFELPPNLDRSHDAEAIIAWFLARDPADFTYDPDRLRYRLNPATS